MTSPRRPLGRHWLTFVLGVLFVGFWVWPVFAEASLTDWQSGFLRAVALLLLATMIFSWGSAQSRGRYDTMQERLVRMEERLDAINFQLFEERTSRTAAERFFDERRRDPDYDHAYRQAWRALRDTPNDDADDDAETDGDDVRDL